MPKVLIVEDNEINRDLLVRRLSRKGYDVIFAVDGLQGVDFAHRELPDLIVMDMGMPKLNGWDATQRLKASPATKHIPVIALTSHAMRDERQRALEVGCDEYLAKPMDFEALTSTIEQLLAKRSPGRNA